MGSWTSFTTTRRTDRNCALRVVDQFTRECLGLVVDTSRPSALVMRELRAIVEKRGAPQRIRNGSELTSPQFMAWCLDTKIEPVYIQPGKAVQNAHSESFNGRMRNEFLNVSWSEHLWDAREKTAVWFNKYDNERRPSSLEYRTPAQFAELLLTAPESAASATSPGLAARPSASGDSAPAADSLSVNGCSKLIS
jgi:putative transposase